MGKNKNKMYNNKGNVFGKMYKNLGKIYTYKFLRANEKNLTCFVCDVNRILVKQF